MNTEIAVLNKINAANLITVRGNQDTNQLLVALAEQQIIDAKRKRDTEAQAIKSHVRFVAEGGGRDAHGGRRRRDPWLPGDPG